jgi:prepilin-type N-terminal cleavage/methylation domain-containing protein
MKLGSHAHSRQIAAFTLVEILIAVTLLGAVAGTSYWSFNMLNTQTVTARLFTNATAIAENELEVFQTDGPFNPQNTPPDIPDSLTIGTFQQTDPVVVYTDPDNDNVIVTGVLTTTVSDPGFTYGTPAVNLNVRQIVVTLTYAYRGRNFVVIMDSMRTSDT